MSSFLKEIQDLSVPELEVKLDAIKKNLFDLRYKAQLATIEKPSDIRNAKRNVARILTLLKDKGEKIKSKNI